MRILARTPRLLRARIGLCALAALAAGCDARRITAPKTAIPATVARSDGAAALLGETTLGPTSEALTPFAGTSPNAWVIVRISGQFSAERNPACLAAEAAMPNAGCPTATGISSFTERLSYMGPVRVWRQSGTSKQQLKVRAGGGGGIALMNARNAATLSAQVHLSVPNWQLPGQNAIPAYFVSGAYTATALEIPAPVELTESAGDGSGLRRYSLQTLHGLEFVNPTEPYYWAFRPTPNVSWRFIPNDVGAAISVRDCDDKTVCTYKPTESGEMQVTTYVEGQQVVIRGSGVPFVPPTMRLTCNADSITRGDGLQCTVAAHPSGTLTDVQWTFVDSAGHAVQAPAGLMSWGGTMVTGGDLRVRAVLNGDTVSADTLIRVNPRRWRRLRIDVNEENPNHLPPPFAVASSSDLGDVHVDTLPTYPTLTISAGPNTGWTYLRDELPPVPVHVHINAPAFASGSAWYALQTGGDYVNPASGAVVPNGYCSAAHVPIIRQLAREHEGSASSSLTSHTDVFRRFLSNNPVHDAMEATVVHRSELTTTLTVHTFYRAQFVAKVTSPLMGDPNQNHKNHPTSPGLVDLAPFPCYARPWN